MLGHWMCPLGDALGELFLQALCSQLGPSPVATCLAVFGGTPTCRRGRSSAVAHRRKPQGTEAERRRCGWEEGEEGEEGLCEAVLSTLLPYASPSAPGHPRTFSSWSPKWGWGLPTHPPAPRGHSLDGDGELPRGALALADEEGAQVLALEEQLLRQVPGDPARVPPVKITRLSTTDPTSALGPNPHPAGWGHRELCACGSSSGSSPPRSWAPHGAAPTR